LSITARDLFFVLRVRDEASNVLNGVSRDLLRVGAAAQAANARTTAAQLRQQAMLGRIHGATQEETDLLVYEAMAYEETARGLERRMRRQQQLASTMRNMAAALTITGLAFVGLGAAGVTALMSTTRAAIEYQQQVAYTRTQVDGFAASLQQLSRIGKDVGRDIAVPFEEVQPALYNIFSSTNANLEEATVLLQNFAKAAVSGQVGIDEASRGTMSILNAFKIPFKDVESVLDVQFQLVRKGVGTYEEFNAVLGRIIPSTVRAGQNLQTMAGIMTFLTRNGLSAAMAATSGARALDAMSNPKAIKNMEEFGIKVKDLKGNFLPLVDILGQLSKKLSGLPAPKRAAILTELFKGAGGTIQAMRFLNLVLAPGQLKEFQALLKSMQNSTGEFGKAYTEMANTTQNKTQLLKNNWQILKVTFGEILMPLFGKLVGAIGLLMQKFNKLTPHQQKMIVYTLLIASAVSILLGTLLLVLSGFAAMAAALAAVGMSIGGIVAVLGGVTAGILATSAAFYTAYKRSAEFRDLIAGIGHDFQDAWTKGFKPFFEGVADSYHRRLEPALRELGQVIETYVIPLLNTLHDKFGPEFQARLQQVLDAIRKVADWGFGVLGRRIREYVIPAIKDLSDWYQKHKAQVDPVIHVTMLLAKWFAIIAGSAVIGALVVALGSLALTIGIGTKFLLLFVSTIIGLGGWIVAAQKWFFGLIDKIRGVGPESKKAVAALGQTFGELPGKVKAWMIGAGVWLLEAGRNLIGGFIEGIREKIPSLKDFIKKQITDRLPDWKGPRFRDLKLLRQSGRWVLEGFMRGLDDMLPRVKRQLTVFTENTKKDGFFPQLPPPPPPPPPGPSQRNVTVPITVNTQEIRPEYHAQQLGNLVAAGIA
jgi:TP901 family phage tail tape measure protein